MRLKVLVNPRGGRGRAPRRIGHALEVFRREGVEVDLEESRSAAHLTELGRVASTAGYDRVVVCGGDGTVHHAVREFDLDRATLAVIPAGSGDDFAETLGIPGDPRRAAEVAIRGRAKEVDVAQVNGIRYLLVASIGFDAAVARFASTISHLRGPAIYLYSIFKVLGQFEPIRVAIDQRQEDVMFAVIANSHRYGGGIRIAPTAAMDDGLLDLYVVSVCSRADLLMTLPLAYLGKHTRRRFVRSARGTRFTLDAATPLEIFADGEFISTTPATIELCPQRLRVIV